MDRRTFLIGAAYVLIAGPALAYDALVNGGHPRQDEDDEGEDEPR